MTRAVAALAIAALAGCASMPEPELRATPANFSEPAATVEAVEAWWLAFEDPLLAALVEEAAAGDDVDLAEARLAEAQAGLRRARAALLPSFSATGSATRLDQAGFDSDTTLGGLEGVWTIDLFGQTRARSALARASREAATARLEAARLAARATAARLYLAYRSSASRAVAFERSVGSLADALSLAESRRIGGLAPELEVAQARAALAAARIPASSARQAATEARLALEALLGREPGSLGAPLSAALTVPQATGTAALQAPAEVLARRPDVRAAERDLAAAGFDARAARRDFFPTLSVAGLFGGQTIDPQTPFTTSGPIGQASASLALPLFTFGRLEAARDAADARFEQAAARYRQAISQALADVERALAATGDAETRRAAATEAVAAARDQAAFARARYTGGLSPFLEVTIAERGLADAEAALAQAEGDAAAAFVTLNEALGLGAAAEDEA